ncbi:centrosomal protein of 126 kDa-like [Ciona intestinalis]
MKNVMNCPIPKQSLQLPLNSPSSTGGAAEHVADSTAAFLLAETLAEQNMSEDQILQAMDSLQRKTKEAQKLGRQVLPSTLSMEEQRLLASLEKLNTRLKEVEATVTNNPNVTFFNQQNMLYAADSSMHDRPMTSYKHNYRSVSADVRYQRGRPRY